MSYDTYEEFAEEMTAILSSGNGSLLTWHETELAELVEGMDRDSVIEHLNIYYADEDPEGLVDGELSLMAELVSKLDPSQKEVDYNVQIVFK